MVQIKHFENLCENKWQSLLLGNGASIALHNKFSYPTLHGVACTAGLLPKTAPIFDKIGTTDFEHTLLACWYADKINKALGNPSNDISEAYEEVRSALISAVREVHPEHANITTELHRVASFASRFQTVISLNYDLTMYWAMLIFNEKNKNWFKDAFKHGVFESDWEYLRQPHNGVQGSTLVFYPHGNLSIARDHLEEETKIEASPGATGNLLETITDRWLSGDFVPVFVSEGRSKDKVAAIYRSHYLTNVYEQVLPKLGNKLVIYGWSFDERDQHILDAIFRNKPEQIAVSVYINQSTDDPAAYCSRVISAVKGLSQDTAVTFFDSQSPKCWNNP